MSDIEKAIESIDKFKHFADLVGSPDEYFQHMQGHSKELSLVICIFDVSESAETVKKALEKQSPKKPKGNNCPVCGGTIVVYSDMTADDERLDYCGDCGQAIDWSVKQ